MLHMFLDDKPWFRAKRYGLGASLPMAWQGWVLMLSYIGLVGGMAWYQEAHGGIETPMMIAGFLVTTALFLLIVWRKTEGGWQWRWGRKK